MKIHDEELAEALESPECFCGNRKRMQQPFCARCFEALPAASRQFVCYIRNDTYHGTYNAALDYLRNHANVNQSQV